MTTFAILITPCRFIFRRVLLDTFWSWLSHESKTIKTNVFFDKILFIYNSTLSSTKFDIKDGDDVAKAEVVRS